MTMLYITEQGSEIRKKGQRIIVEKEGRELAEVQCHVLEAVLLFGNVQFTTQSLREMLKHGIDFGFLTLRGELVGRLVPPQSKNVLLRLAQHRVFQNANARLRLSRAVVRGKLENALALLRRHGYNHPEAGLGEPIGLLEKVRTRVEAMDSPESLLGLEGTLSRLYFAGFEKMLRGEYVFERRSTRPPHNEVNACLSFGYVLMGNEILSILEAMGFDAYVGFYHTPQYGRPSLMLDLLEEFRHAVVDPLVLQLFNRGVFKDGDFRRGGGEPEGSEEGAGCFLTVEGKRSFLKAYERQLSRSFLHPVRGERVDFRRCFRLQAEALSRAILKGEEYVPFRLDV